MRALFLAICLLLASPAWAGSVYVVTDLGTLGGTVSRATAINNKGQIVGWSRLPSTEVRAVEFNSNDPSQIRELGNLEGGSTQAFGISDSGVIVGSSRLANNGPFRAVTFDADGPGTVRDLGNGSANAANSNGLIIGNRGGTPILFDSTGGENNKDLGGLRGPPGNNGASGINSKNQVVGSAETQNFGRQATLYDVSDPSKNRALGFVGKVSVAVDINDKGQAIGGATLDNGKSRIVLWDANTPGSFEIFKPFEELTSHQAMAINNKGEFIGLSAGAERMPWIFDPEAAEFFAINSLIYRHDPLFGLISIFTLDDINDRGQIVGVAEYTDGPLSGEFHAVLLTPVPVPAALPLFLAALSALGLIFWKRRKTEF